MRITFSIKGYERAMHKLAMLDDEGREEIDKILAANMNEAVANAKSYAGRVKDKGKLIQSISSRREEPLLHAMTNNVSYAAYHEFGTGKYASVYVPTLPDNLQAVAKKYRGQGKRKVNIKTTRFMYRALLQQMPQIIDDIKRAL